MPAANAQAIAAARHKRDRWYARAKDMKIDLAF
jgi:hypothetical protein